MRLAVSELENQLRNTTNLLAEFKHRAYMAEVRDTRYGYIYRLTPYRRKSSRLLRPTLIKLSIWKKSSRRRLC